MDLYTQVKILESPTMAELVIHRLNLDALPEFAGKAQTQTSGGIAISESPTQDFVHARNSSFANSRQI